MPRARPGPEQEARPQIDAQLAQAGWEVQDRDDANLSASLGIAVREFKLAEGHGFADYLLFVEGKTVGVVEAKPAGVLPDRRRAASDQILLRPSGRAQPAAQSPALPLREHWSRDPLHQPAGPRTPQPRSVDDHRSHPSAGDTGGVAESRAESPVACRGARGRGRATQGPSIDAPLAHPRSSTRRTRPPLPQPCRGSREARALARAEQAALPGADGHRLGQDHLRHHRDLPPRQARRGAARPVPRRPEEPG